MKAIHTMKTIHPSLTLTLLLAAVATGFSQPTFTRQPASQSVSSGADALFAVAATSTSLAATAESSAESVPAKTSQAIPWSQIGAKAGADYKGDGLAVSPTAEGARLRCAFQKLEGQATRQGLWLTSTVIPPSGTVNDRFRIVAAAVGRELGGVQRGNVG